MIIIIIYIITLENLEYCLGNNLFQRKKLKMTFDSNLNFTCQQYFWKVKVLMPLSMKVM